MSSLRSSAVVCSGLSFTWPDGTPALTDLDATFAACRTGLVGVNGAGKTTLLRLLAGELPTTTGQIATAGDVAYLRQRLPDAASTVADLLGVSARRGALRAIEDGNADPVHFATLADDWDVESRAIEALRRLGVLLGERNPLDRTIGTVSGGETVLIGVAGLLLRRASISLLDEPSNNLDRRAREVLHAAIESWPGVLVIASHDRELLEHMDQIVELREGRTGEARAEDRRSQPPQRGPGVGRQAPRGSHRAVGRSHGRTRPGTGPGA